MKAPRVGKYNARRVSLDGFTFASQAEGRRYLVLRQRLRDGEIADLELQPRWRLEVNGYLIGRYTADFTYRDLLTGERVVEDVKSRPTRTEAYRLRKRLMWALFDIEIFEVHA